MSRRLLLAALAVAVVGVGLVVLGRRGSTAEVAGQPPSASADWSPRPGDWPCWRGPDGSNRTDARAPLRWDASAGIRWRTRLPGRGHAAPLVCGERVFALSADDSAQTLHCLDAATGEETWSHPTLTGGAMGKHVKNTHASSTPACDGDRVFVAGIAHGALWVTAVGVDGQRRWQRRVGPFSSQHGYGSSVALARGLVIVSGENRGTGLGRLSGVTSYLAALTRDTGEVAWLVRRPAVPSYGTPAIVGDRVVIAGATAVSAYDVLTGAIAWEHPWDEARHASTVAAANGRVFASRTMPAAQAVALDAATGRPAWEQSAGAADVPSPVCDGGRLYLLNDGGMLSCLDEVSGELRWKLRLTGAFTASPIVVGGLVYCTSEQGTTFVVRPGDDRGQIVSRNALGETTLASAVPVGGRLYFRTDAGVTCVEGADAIGRAD